MLPLRKHTRQDWEKINYHFTNNDVTKARHKTFPFNHSVRLLLSGADIKVV